MTDHQIVSLTIFAKISLFFAPKLSQQRGGDTKMWDTYFDITVSYRSTESHVLRVPRVLRALCYGHPSPMLLHDLYCEVASSCTTPSVLVFCLAWPWFWCVLTLVISPVHDNAWNSPNVVSKLFLVHTQSILFIYLFTEIGVFLRTCLIMSN